MKHFTSLPSRLGAVLILAAAGAVALAPAQQPAAPAAATQLKIINMPNPKRVNVPTPEFQIRGSTPQALSRGRAREWAVIDVDYETKFPASAKDKWTDNVSATFYVLAEATLPDRTKEFSLYTLTVRYVNVPEGKHRAGVVLPPGALERYGQVVAIACEITADGVAAPEVKGEHAASELNAYKDDWWKNDKVTGAPFVKKRDGVLLERSKTPFGLVNMDDYEAVR